MKAKRRIIAPSSERLLKTSFSCHLLMVSSLYSASGSGVGDISMCFSGTLTWIMGPIIASSAIPSLKSHKR